MRNKIALKFGTTLLLITRQRAWIKNFGDAAARLATHPKIGKTGKISGTRELIPQENYRMVYEIDGCTVWVLALVHTARRWPPVK